VCIVTRPHDESIAFGSLASPFTMCTNILSNIGTPILPIHLGELIISFCSENRLNLRKLNLGSGFGLKVFKKNLRDLDTAFSQIMLCYYFWLLKKIFNQLFKIIKMYPLFKQRS